MSEIIQDWEETLPPPAPKVNRFYPYPKSHKAQALLAYRLNMVVMNRKERRAQARAMVRAIKRFHNLEP